MNGEHFDFEKRIATPEEREELQRALGQQGLVDATLFDWPVEIEHPFDNVWKSVN